MKTEQDRQRREIKRLVRQHAVEISVCVALNSRVPSSHDDEPDTATAGAWAFEDGSKTSIYEPLIGLAVGKARDGHELDGGTMPD